MNFQDKDEHLDLLEGVLIDLLKTKWETFVKAKFYRQFYIFTVYFFISLAAFGLRPKAYSEDDDDDEKGKNSTLNGLNLNETNSPVKSFMFNNLTEILCNYSTIYQEAMTILTNSTDNSTSTDDNEMDEWTSFSTCPLLDISTVQLKVKLVAEYLLSVFALYYILTALRELRFLGAKMFFENLVRSFLNFMKISLNSHCVHFIEHCTITCHVSVLLLVNVDSAIFKILLPS